MPRRVYTYPAESGWGMLNLISTGGAMLLAVGGLMLLYNVVRSAYAGEPAGSDPWGGETLEWATSSPPPVYNFLHLPVVEGRSALWQMTREAPPVVVGVDPTSREVLITSVTDAEPQNKTHYPDPTIWPFLSAVVTSAFFIGSIFSAWALPAALVPLTIVLTGWFWPRRSERSTQVELQHSHLVEARGEA
jgi:cytochrome c oxidase subunit 1